MRIPGTFARSAMSGALLVAGTTSDAGKSMVVAGLCRLLARKGIRVAPFKAQNMSNNSAVTVDGGEIGRAQAMQARAAGLAPSVRFNPVLLKPGSDRTSQLVVRGQVAGIVAAADYVTHRDRLADIVADELASLRSEFDVVICEGAGSPAEINLRATDLANMGLARAAQLPVVLVGDIDRGGLLAHLFGTVAVLEPEDQALISGFVVNKFRGDPALLAPGLTSCSDLTGRPTYGVIPYADGLWLDAEDSLSVLAAPRGRATRSPPRGADWLRVAAVRLPRISNSTDVEALACEPGVLVRWVADPAELADADVVVIPGSKATVSDLAWLRERGLADGVIARAAAGRPVLGICGGFQMLCRTIDDPVESGAGPVEGLGLLDADIVFAPEKTLRHWDDVRCAATRSTTARSPAARRRPGSRPSPSQGVADGAVYGTHWHGLLDNDEFRRRGSPTPPRRRAGTVRRRRRRRRGRAPRRPAGPDGRPADRPPRRRRRHRPASDGAPRRPRSDRHSAWVAWGHDQAAGGGVCRGGCSSACSPAARTPLPGTADLAGRATGQGPADRRRLSAGRAVRPHHRGPRPARRRRRRRRRCCPSPRVRRGLTKVIADVRRARRRAAPRSTPSPTTAPGCVMTVLTWPLDIDRLAATAERCANFRDLLRPGVGTDPDDHHPTGDAAPRRAGLSADDGFGQHAEQCLLLVRERRLDGRFRDRVPDAESRRSPSKARCRRRFWTSPAKQAERVRTP